MLYSTTVKISRRVIILVCSEATHRRGFMLMTLQLRTKRGQEMLKIYICYFYRNWVRLIFYGWYYFLIAIHTIQRAVYILHKINYILLFVYSAFTLLYNFIEIYCFAYLHIHLFTSYDCLLDNSRGIIM